MPTIDTRHTEKTTLFSLLEAEYTKDIKTQIRRMKASMEPEDVEQVLREFEEWKAERRNKK